MKNGKAFLFKSRLGTAFVVAFVKDDAGRVFGRAFGYVAFPTHGFNPMHSINQATSWLKSQGNAYIKRLPLTQGTDFTTECEKQIWVWLSEASAMRDAG